MKKYMKFVRLLLVIVLCISNIKVDAQPVKIIAPQKTIYVKQKIQFSITPKRLKRKVKWKSSNSRNAAVSKDGMVTGKRIGKAKIYAYYNNKRITVSIKVQRFKKKNIITKGILTDASDEILEYLNNKYKVFNSKQEVNNFVQSVDSKNPVDVNIYHSVRKKLKNYKKSFFRKKSLCLLRIAEISGDYDISLGNMYLVQSKQGKILGQITAKIQKFNEPDVASQGDITTYYGILELSKKDVKQIQGYTVKKIITNTRN